MDLKLLHTFVVAAELENFHQTAERLYLTQPTVTAHIRQLEAELGFPLFERVNKRVRLTQAGHRFLPHARRVIETYEQAVNDMTAWWQGFEARLQLVSSPLVATSVLPGLLKEFTRRHPNVELMVLTAVSPDIGQTVAAGAAQVGLSRAPSNHPDTVSTVLYLDPVLLVASPQHAAAPTWQELLASQLLLTGNHPVYWDALLMNLSERQPHLRTLAVDRVDITKRMLEEGLGVSFLPRSSVMRELAEGRLVTIPVTDMTLPTAATYLILPFERELPKAAHDFIQLLQNSFPDQTVPERSGAL
ncbi:MAG: LysR family transcriptional regulator [Bacillota bacterium]